MDVRLPASAPDKVAEVVSSKTTEFTAQCYEVNQSPPFGSLVKVCGRDTTIYGVIYNISTGSIDPGRRPIARGREEESEEAVYRSNPQLLKLLRTDFSALIIGYRQSGAVRGYLPPNPPGIHGFVFPCNADEVQELSRSLAFLGPMVVAQLGVPTEELVAACLRQMGQAWPEPEKFLVSAGKELSMLLTRDLNRFNNIVRRIR